MHDLMLFPIVYIGIAITAMLIGIIIVIGAWTVAWMEKKLNIYVFTTKEIETKNKKFKIHIEENND